jgi:hypothetical protein
VTEPDPLAGLRDQIRLATEAAERLVADVRAGRTAPDPPAGRQEARGYGAEPDPPTPPADRQEARGDGAAPDPPAGRQEARGDGAADDPPAGRQEARGAADDPPTPRAGWQEARGDGAADELAALARLLDALRALLPAELQAQVTDLIRQLLIVLRALIDWAVTRLEADGRGREVEVWDIPID